MAQAPSRLEHSLFRRMREYGFIAGVVCDHYLDEICIYLASTHYQILAPHLSVL